MNNVFLRRILFPLGAAVVVEGRSKTKSDGEGTSVESAPVKITATASAELAADTRLGYDESESGINFTWTDHSGGA